MRAQSVSGTYGTRNRGSVLNAHRLVSQEKSQGNLNLQVNANLEKLANTNATYKLSAIYDSLSHRVQLNPQKQVVAKESIPHQMDSSKKKAHFVNISKSSQLGSPEAWLAQKSRSIIAQQGQSRSKLSSRPESTTPQQLQFEVEGHQQQQPRNSPRQLYAKNNNYYSNSNTHELERQVMQKLSIGSPILASPMNNYTSHYTQQMDLMNLQVSDDFTKIMSKDVSNNTGVMSRAHKNRITSTAATGLKESETKMTQSAVIPPSDREWFRSGTQSSNHQLTRSPLERSMVSPSQLDGEFMSSPIQINDKLGNKSECRVSSSREVQTKGLTRNTTGLQDQFFAKRSFSAVKSAPKQSAISTGKKSNQSLQLMILKVKQQCTQKKYNDPLEIKKEKDRIKNNINTPAGTSGSKSGVVSAHIRVRLTKESMGQEDDDDDSVDAGSNDVSLDLDDDEEEQNNQQLLKKSSSLAGNAMNNLSKVVLLKSIYAGRPMTVFFQYHKSCQQSQLRDTTRTVACSEFEAKKFDLKYKINGDNPYKCVMKAFEENGFTATDEGDWNAQWSLPKKDKVRTMNQFKKFNHFPGCWNLGRKDFMWRCLNRAKRRSPKEFDFVPNTYLLCNQGDWERFLTRKEEASKNQLWICKPADQACGRGIRVISKTSKVKRKTNRIICDYIMNPHLIEGLKYDLRLYVLVTSYDPLRIYLYDEGLTRFATEKYTTNTKEVTKRYVHLTNYSVNKYAKKFVKNTNPENDGEGSKWSHSALRAKYAAMGIDVQDLFSKISDVIIKTCISAEPNMLDIHAKSSEHRTNCFELYGFDVLIDANLKPWILEVNVCPSLSSSSPLDRKIKHSLLVDTLNIVGINPYDKKHYNEQTKKGQLLHRASTASMATANEDVDVRNSSLVNIKKTFSKNVNDIQDLNAQNCLEKLSPENWEILFETDEEYHRRGHYERIYPPMEQEKRQYYAQFFEYQRFNNIMVDRWMGSSVNFLQKVIRKRYNTSV